MFRSQRRSPIGSITNLGTLSNLAARRELVVRQIHTWCHFHFPLCLVRVIESFENDLQS